MTTVQLLGNFVGPPGLSGNGAANFEWASRFYSDEDSYVKNMRWYRGSVGTPAPSAMRLWDSVTQSVVVTAPVIPDNGAVGWQAYSFPISPYTLIAGRVYVVSISTPFNFAYTYQATSSPIVPDAPLHFDSNARAFKTNAYTYPNVTDNAYYMLVDIGVETAPITVVPGEPTTNSTLDQRLQAWLDKDSTDYPDSTPILTHTLAGENQTRLDTLISKVDAGGWPVAIGGVNKANIPAWLSAAGTIISATASVADSIKAWTDAPTVPAGGATSASILALAAQIQNGDLRYLTAPGSAGWTLDATVPFAGTFVADQDADVIFVNITTIGSERVTNTIGGLSFLTMPWWWVPLRAGAIAGRYHTSRALTADLYEPGRRLSGALVVLPADFEGEYEVWRYTG